MNGIAPTDNAMRRISEAVRQSEQYARDSKNSGRDDRKRPSDWRFFIVKDEGPASESDYTDERYFVQLVELTNSDSDPTSKLTFAAIPNTDDRYQYVTATNLSEWMDETHNLTAGSVVPVFTAYSAASVEIARRFFNFPA